MLPVRRILCPTDFSEPSFKAMKLAGELAVHFGSRLVVLHVVSLAPVVPGSAAAATFTEKYQKQLEEAAWKELEQATNRLVPREVKEFLPRIVGGYYTDEILRIAKEERSDLIVMGTRGRTGLPHFILGSVAERVVQLAPCPVLTVGPTVEV